MKKAMQLFWRNYELDLKTWEDAELNERRETLEDAILTAIMDETTEELDSMGLNFDRKALFYINVECIRRDKAKREKLQLNLFD